MRRASDSWLRSWKVSARSYSRRATSILVARGCPRSPGSRPTRPPRRCTGPLHRCRRPRPRGRDAGDLEEVLRGRRLVRQAGLARGRPPRRRRRCPPGCRARRARAALSMTSVSATHSPVVVVLVAGPRAERAVRRDRQVVRVVVDEHHAAEVRGCGPVALQEALELLGGVVQEGGALDAGLQWRSRPAGRRCARRSSSASSAWSSARGGTRGRVPSARGGTWRGDARTSTRRPGGRWRVSARPPPACRWSRSRAAPAG